MVSVGLILEIQKLAFSRQVRNRIKDAANGWCHDCQTEVGTEKLIAAHLLHGTAKQLDKECNGVARCYFCEAQYHLRHADCPSEIGLRKQDNDSITYGHMNSLAEEQRAFLIRTFPEQWSGIVKRLDKN